jgi:hypothetical protein
MQRHATKSTGQPLFIKMLNSFNLFFFYHLSPNMIKTCCKQEHLFATNGLRSMRLNAVVVIKTVGSQPLLLVGWNNCVRQVEVGFEKVGGKLKRQVHLARAFLLRCLDLCCLCLPHTSPPWRTRVTLGGWAQPRASWLVVLVACRSSLLATHSTRSRSSCRRQHEANTLAW